MTIIYFIIIGIICFFVGFLIQKKVQQFKEKSAETVAEKLIEGAKKEAGKYKITAELELKAEYSQKRIDFERETRNKRKEIELLENKVQEKERNCDRKQDLLTKKEHELELLLKDVEAKDRAVKAKSEKFDSLIKLENEKLQSISGMTQEEAKKVLLANLEEEARYEARERTKKIKEEGEQQALKEVRRITTTAIERYAIEHTIETTTSTISLPNEEMKGRLIGREGRNIRAFETATGVDLVIDDTPETVSASCFDPVKREIAKITLERLVADGRIHPSRIEELAKKVEKEVIETMNKAGEEMCIELRVKEIHPEIVKLLGKLRFRTSYGQNVLQHSNEVAVIAGLMASELGLDEELARRAGLLHDIGKAIPGKEGGTHQKVGAEIAKKYGECDIVVNSIAAHHKDVEPTSPIAVLVQASDAISGARPGARRETFEAYIERLEKLENVVNSFDGVEKSYVIQAGREVRVIVSPESISDAGITELADSIAQKIEGELKYPGEIKVTVIRETRAVEYAK